MSDYRYLVFPRGKQPTVDEAAEFHNLSGILAGKFAIGLSKKTGGLAIAFKAAAFNDTLAKQRGFASLVYKWEVRGCEVLERLPFVKDAAALQPVQPNFLDPDKSSSHRSTTVGKRLSAKELAAKEAVARSLLGVQRTLDRYDALHRYAALVPYLLIALGTLGTILVGFYAGNRLLDPQTEKHRETTVRVSSDPMHQPLERQPVQAE